MLLPPRRAHQLVLISRCLQHLQHPRRRPRHLQRLRRPPQHLQRQQANEILLSPKVIQDWRPRWRRLGHIR